MDGQGVDKSSRPKKTKWTSGSEEDSFDQTGRESVDSGRVSRRGLSEESLQESDPDEDFVPNDGMPNDNTDEREGESSINVGWKKEQGKAKIVDLVAAGVRGTSEPEDAGSVTGSENGQRGEDDPVETTLAVGSGYRDGSCSVSPDGCGDSALEGVVEQYDYSSMPASRQGDRGEEEDGGEMGNERVCKSAGASREEQRQELLHKSKSAPALGREREGQRVEDEPRHVCRKDAFGSQDNVTPTGVADICGSVASSAVSDTGAKESVLSTVSSRFKDIASAVSVVKQLQAVNSRTITHETPGIPNEFSKGSQESVKHTPVSGETMLTAKSVTWEDMAPGIRPDSANSVSKDPTVMYPSERASEMETSVIQDNTKVDDSLSGEVDNGDQATSNEFFKVGESLDSEPHGTDANDDRLSQTRDKDEPTEEPDTSLLSNFSVSHPLTKILHTIGRIKESSHGSGSRVGTLDTEKLSQYHSLFQDVTNIMKECGGVPDSINQALPTIRKQLLDLQEELVADLREGGENPTHEAAAEESTPEDEEKSAEFQAAITNTMLNISEAIMAAVAAEVVVYGTTEDLQEAVAWAQHVYDGTYAPPAVESEDTSDMSDDSPTSDTSHEPVAYISDWPRYVCSTGACLGEDVLTCIVHADQDVVSFSQLKCDVVDPTFLPSVTEEFETLVGRVIRVTAEEEEKTSSTDCYLVALPFRASLVESWQTVEVRELTDTGEWTRKPRTGHKAVLDDQEENVFSFIEVETDRPSTLAVVACAKTDRIKFGANAKTVTSTGDPRISVGIAENTCYGECQMKMQVFMTDACAIHEFRIIQEENAIFKAASPIIQMSFTEDITSPVRVTLPVFMPLKRVMRASGRPIPKPDPFNENELLLFQQHGRDEWKYIRYTRVSNVKGAPGMVTLEWFEKEGRFIIIYVAKHASKKIIDAKATLFLKYLTLKVVEVTLLQDPKCVRKISVSLCPKQHGVRKKRPPKEEIDFTFVNDFLLREGQPFDISLRGNLRSTWKFPQTFMSYAVEPIKFNFEVDVLDRYSQRSLSHFCGFMQMLDPLRILAEPPKVGKSKDHSWEEKDENPILLSEICIKLPKPEATPAPPLVRAPFNIKLSGGVSFETLREVALEVSEEWRQLARHLHLPHSRVQSIVRNTKGKQPCRIALEVLLTWIKRAPIYLDKPRVLCDALLQCGRSDLVHTIRERDREQKEVETKIATAYNLKKAIVIVCRSPTVVNQWRALAVRLGLSNDDVAELDFLSRDQHDVCRMVLERWQSLVNARAEVKVLAQQLASLGCVHVAELISTAYGSTRIT